MSRTRSKRISWRRAGALAAGLAAALTSCGTEGPAASGSGPHRLATTRAQVYGDAQGPGILAQVFDVEVGPDGRVYASQPPLAEVTVFDAGGGYSATLGGRGQGPGEFQVPGAVRFHGDTLTVLEFQRGISLFGPHGSFVRRIFVDLPPPPGHSFSVRAMCVLADGSLLGLSPLSPTNVLRDGADRDVWLRISRDGDVLDTLVVQPVDGRFFQVEGAGESPLPLGHPTPWSDLAEVPPDGSGLVAVSRAPATDPDTAVYRVYRVDLAGDTVLDGKVPYDPVPVTEAWKDSVSQRLAASSAARLGVTPERLAGLVRDAVPWPLYHPPVSNAVAGDDGTVWIRREPVPGDSVRWDVLARNLEQVGYVVLPVGFDVKRVSREAVWGVELDPLDVPSIVRLDVGGLTPRGSR